MLFTIETINSELTKKKIFTIDLNVDIFNAETGPGDSLLVNPQIFNSSTEEMYVFIELKLPKYENEYLYTYDVDEAWIFIEDTEKGLVHGYGDVYPEVLLPGGETSSLTDAMTFAEISNESFYQVDDINFEIAGYAIERGNLDVDMKSVWEACKLAANE